MKPLFPIVCVLAAFFVSSETLQCYYCKEATLAECDNNAIIKNCTNVEDQCMTRDAVLNNNSYSFTMVKKDCLLYASIQTYCSFTYFTGVDGVPTSFNNITCTTRNCTGDLCNSPRTTTPMPTTSSSTTGELNSTGATQTPSTAGPGTTVPTSPTGSCGKQSFYINTVIVALLSSISFFA